ncbi:MAG: protein translocase subunit SecD, partial [Chloroflexi bacterium]|nr:protein translocase subunit SecD [Chloroflexota bacterium]
MPSRNSLTLIIVLIVFVLAALVVFPIEKGVLGGKGIRLGLDLQGGTRLTYKADLSSVVDEDEAILGAISVLENRINPLGVSESDVRKLGTDEILVEVPGRSLTDKEKESLGNVALLEFGELVTGNETFRWENSLGKWKPATAPLNGVETELTSRYFKTNTFISRGNLGQIL